MALTMPLKIKKEHIQSPKKDTSEGPYIQTSSDSANKKKKVLIPKLALKIEGSAANALLAIVKNQVKKVVHI